jgi:hypothetical protein
VLSGHDTLLPPPEQFNGVSLSVNQEFDLAFPQAWFIVFYASHDTKARVAFAITNGRGTKNVLG